MVLSVSAANGKPNLLGISKKVMWLKLRGSSHFRKSGNRFPSCPSCSWSLYLGSLLSSVSFTYHYVFDVVTSCTSYSGWFKWHVVVQSLNVSNDPTDCKCARLPCPSPSPRVCSNSCPLRQWCHPTISSSVIPFSSCLQSFPASGSFPMSQFFASGGQSIGASASVLLVNIQDWFPE